MDKLYGRLVSTGCLTGCLSSEKTIAGGLAALNPWGEYSGSVEVTPTTEEQVLQTQGKHLGEDIVIKPIPSNYGLITWSGLGIRVS